MQLSTNEFIYEFKEGKPARIYFKGLLYAEIYTQNEGAVQSITQFMNMNYIPQPEQQIANRLHNDKITNPRTGENY